MVVGGRFLFMVAMGRMRDPLPSTSEGRSVTLDTKNRQLGGFAHHREDPKRIAFAGSSAHPGLAGVVDGDSKDASNPPNM